MPLLLHLEVSSSSFLKCARNHSSEAMQEALAENAIYISSPAVMYISAGRTESQRSPPSRLSGQSEGHLLLSRRL